METVEPDATPRWPLGHTIGTRDGGVDVEAEASFGRLIKNRRRSLDLTQDERARRGGSSVITIRKVEAAERRPSRQLAERLARCVNVAPEERHTFVTLA